MPRPEDSSSSTIFSAMSSPSSCLASFFLRAAVLGFFGLGGSAAADSFFAARAACLARLSAMSWGISAVSNGFAARSSNISPRACLQGNCRLGQEQRQTGASWLVKSMDTR